MVLASVSLTLFCPHFEPITITVDSFLMSMTGGRNWFFVACLFHFTLDDQKAIDSKVIKNLGFAS
jgi:hypothetical protein